MILRRAILQCLQKVDSRQPVDFLKLERQVRIHQISHNRIYRQWIQTFESTHALPIVAYKESRVLSFRAKKPAAIFESSGTTAFGKPTVSRHALKSLDLYRESVCRGWDWLMRSLNESSPDQFVGLMPSAHEAPKSSLSRMVHFLMHSHGGKQECWAMKRNRWMWPSLTQKLKRIQTPLVLFGTAFGWVHYLDWCQSHHQRLSLHPRSLVIETGGYKGRSRELTRTELHRQLSLLLGVSRQRIRSEYSMCELSSQAYSFPSRSGHRFRFPPWCRHRVVRPLSHQVCPRGVEGVLEITDLANLDSCAFIRTEDRAIDHPDGFELLGRLPGADWKGCSLRFE